MRPVPALRPTRKLTVPKTSERTLANGLRVLALRRASVPLVEMRMRVPFGSARLSESHTARASMLSQTLFSGTPTRSTVDIAADLQAVGGALSAGVDADRLQISGNALIGGFDRMLEILTEVLTEATYPVDEVSTERDRMADRIQVALSQPAHLVRLALLRRRYGRHPYAVQSPGLDHVRSVTPAALRTLHAQRVHATGSTLVVVGDLNPDRALDAIEEHLSTWDGGGKDVQVPPVPEQEPAAALVVDRPGSVQSSLRMILPAVPREHSDHPALQLINLIFGGYFSSRWVENIREDKGYTYSPHSMVDHSSAGSSLLLMADVATGVTAPALLETLYELGRLATQPPNEQELEQARQYALGVLQLGMSTQAGLANLAVTYASAGLDLDFLVAHAAKVAAATREDVAAVGAKYLAPAQAMTVVLGDADKIADSLTTLGPVDRIGVDGVTAG